MTPFQTGMYGLVGSDDTPAPCSMICVSCCDVRVEATACRPGTSAETLPSPRGPWHWAQENWVKARAPTATSCDTGAGLPGAGWLDAVGAGALFRPDQNAARATAITTTVIAATANR